MHIIIIFMARTDKFSVKDGQVNCQQINSSDEEQEKDRIPITYQSKHIKKFRPDKDIGILKQSKKRTDNNSTKIVNRPLTIVYKKAMNGTGKLFFENNYKGAEICFTSLKSHKGFLVVMLVQLYKLGRQTLLKAFQIFQAECDRLKMIYKLSEDKIKELDCEEEAFQEFIFGNAKKAIQIYYRFQGMSQKNNCKKNIQYAQRQMKWFDFNQLFINLQ